MSIVASGALAGWKRDRAKHGIVLTLQVAASKEDFDRRAFAGITIAVNDRQLRSLARDLTRAAEEQGLELFASRRWWRFWRPRADRAM